MKLIQTINGEVRPEMLGKTLMHEHLCFGFPGSEIDNRTRGPVLREMVAICVDKVEELKAAGFRSLLDPCPNDMGRNIDLMGEVAARTGFNIICASGMYNECFGANAYWRAMQAYGSDCAQALAEVFIKELTVGIGDGNFRAGIIKVATAQPVITPFERSLLRAAAIASAETGIPITTHTDAVLGDEQVEILNSHGVPGDHVIVGHCCGSADHDYHMRIIDKGAYVGFDRFGAVVLRSDEDRITSLLQLRARGRLDRVIISHDSVWCWRNMPFPKEFLEPLSETSHPLHFTQRIVPRLREHKVTDAEIDLLLIGNPRRFFEGTLPH